MIFVSCGRVRWKNYKNLKFISNQFCYWWYKHHSQLFVRKGWNSTHVNRHRHTQTRVYFKDTDTHQLLHKQSFHPRHTFTGVLKAELLRFKRISSSFSDYSDTCSVLFAALRTRNYSKSLLRKMNRDIWFDNDISPKSNSQKRILPIVIIK